MFASTAPRSLRTLTARLAQTTAQLQPRTHFRMAHNGTTATLNTGAKIPLLGFGTWQDKDAQEPAVTVALKAGYRHIDTARIYGTETAVGNAIIKSGVPREQIFLTTKLWNNKHRESLTRCLRQPFMHSWIHELDFTMRTLIRPALILAYL